MSFHARKAQADTAEKTVLYQLRIAGFSAWEFGQGLLPLEFRDALKRYKAPDGRASLIRWLPDIIAFDKGDPPTVVLLDVKIDNPQHPNYAIETSALEACEAIQDHFYTPCWFIFPGLKIFTPEMVRCNARLGAPSINGSGTPYVLVNKSSAIPLANAIERERDLANDPSKGNT